MQTYRDAGGKGRTQAGVKICWAESEDDAKQTVFRLWRHSGLGGTINQELPRPSDFDAVAESVTKEMATGSLPCGPDPEPVLAEIRKWQEAGFDRIALHQVGPDQDGFFRFWEQELQPALS
jgi:alkanesulfonate monooxygenase SsuD/methylene tetrahydromethanopterin reductase-like flavin-dependent oxidoreductase (luciferase family)